VRAPEGNGCAELSICTLKVNLRWAHHVEDIEDLAQALLAFQKSYNYNWLITRHGFQTLNAIQHKQPPLTALAA
jgi:hypothetical protein